MSEYAVFLDNGCNTTVVRSTIPTWHHPSPEKYTIMFLIL